jgi:hypothetical protein
MSSLRAAIRATAVTIDGMGSRASTKTDSRLAARLAALASLGAATIHFAVVPNHWQEWMPAGVFFVLIALFQLLWAKVVLARTTTLILAAGVMLNVGAIALWAVSRTAGAPFGPHAGQAELVQAADLCALLLQIYVVMGAGWALYRGRPGQQIPAFGNAIIALSAIAVVALASTVGVASGLRHGHHAPDGAAGSDHHEASVGHSGGHHDHQTTPVISPPIIEPLRAPTAPPPIEAPLPRAEPSQDAHDDHDHAH